LTAAVTPVEPMPVTDVPQATGVVPLSAANEMETALSGSEPPPQATRKLAVRAVRREEIQSVCFM